MGERVRYAVGIDVGATNVKMGIVDSCGRISIKKTAPVGDNGTAQKLIQLIKTCIDGIREEFPHAVVAAGCGIPGIVDVKSGIVYKSPNYPGWKSHSIREDLSRAIGLPVALDNDANLFALGEQRYGAGRGCDNMILLTLGTGIGGGLILNGELFHGDVGFAGEVGHITIEESGRECGCGNHGCWELYAASRAFATFASRLSAEERDALLASAGVEKEEGLTPEVMAGLAGSGNRTAAASWEWFGKYLGLGIADLINVLGVTTFVIGGGISASWNLFAESARWEVSRHTYGENARKLVLKRAELGNDAGILGAAAEAFALGAISGSRTRGA